MYPGYATAQIYAPGTQTQKGQCVMDPDIDHERVLHKITVKRAQR